MLRKVILISAALTLAGGCSTVTPRIDYDTRVDFTQFKTFDWADTEATSVKDTSELMHRRIKDAIIARLEEGGLKRVTSNPQLYVTYHTEESREVRVDTNHWGYGYGGGSYYMNPYWGHGMGMGGTTTSVREYTMGTLIIDIWQASTKSLIWRGTAESVVSNNPQKEIKKIDTALEKLSKEWDRKYTSRLAPKAE